MLIVVKSKVKHVFGCKTTTKVKSNNKVNTLIGILQLWTDLDGDGTRITGMADTEVTQNSVVSLGCHSKSARSQKPTRLRWLLNGIEAPFDLIRPLPAGGLFENELSLALHFRLDTAFWTKWSNTREIGGRRSLIIKCEALYTKTLLHSERTVTLHVRQVSDNLQSPADYLQKHSVSCKSWKSLKT